MTRCPSARLTLVLSVLVMLLAASVVPAGATTVAGGTWSWQNPKYQGNTLGEVTYADADNVWAVGEHGTFMHSTDGGSTWKSQTLGRQRPLVDVSFVDAEHGWLIGPTSVYRTTDGGVTWSANDDFRKDRMLYAGTFADREHGWVVGEGGLVMATSDGGVTWRQQMTSVATALYAVDFATPTDGWVTGAGGVVLHTLDGGASWLPGYSVTAGDVYDVSFADAMHGCVIQAGRLMSTKDGGDSWKTQVATSTVGVYLQGMAGWAIIVDPTDLGSSRLIRSMDGGETWSDPWTDIRKVPSCWDVALADAERGCAVGPGGQTLQTADGGLSWDRRAGATYEESLSDVTFTDSLHGWAVGDVGVLYTADSGATWTPRNSGLTSDIKLKGAYFPSALKGWTVGSEGWVFRTDDGGANWAPQAADTSETLRAVTFSDPLNGWAVGENGTIRHTADAGATTWTAHPDSSGAPADFRAVTFTDALHGFAVGSVSSDFASVRTAEGVIVRTTDGGTTWTRQAFPRTAVVTDVHFIDAAHGFVTAAGEVKMMYTADGGATWTIRSPGIPPAMPSGWSWWVKDFAFPQLNPFIFDWYHLSLYGIDFADAKNGWAVGEFGTIVHTTDGGANWSPQVSNTFNRLTAVSVPDAEHAWTVGDFGTILTAGGAEVAPVVPVTTVGKPTASVEGATRIGTAIEAAKAAFTSADTVVIATGWNFPDALGGSALAGALDAPLLLTDKDSLPTAVADEIKRLGAKDAVILGGTPAVGSGVANQLAALLGGSTHVRRIGGADRYETAALVAAETVSTLKTKGRPFDGTAFVAVGDNFPDALAASPLAAAKGWPILLTRTGALPSATANHITSLGVTKAVVLGSENVVSAEVAGQLAAKVGAGNVSRLSGATRYLTAIEIAKYGQSHGMGFTKLAIATGENYPDALSGGVMAGRFNSMMLLTPQTSLEPNVGALIGANKADVEKVYYLGSTSAVSKAVRDAVANVLK